MPIHAELLWVQVLYSLSIYTLAAIMGKKTTPVPKKTAKVNKEEKAKAKATPKVKQSNLRMMVQMRLAELKYPSSSQLSCIKPKTQGISKLRVRKWFWRMGIPSKTYLGFQILLCLSHSSLIMPGNVF